MGKAAKTGKKRILIVDDAPDITRVVKLYLEGTEDYVVREENDANAALSAAEEFQPQLILLDVGMPGMDGLKLATHFRASPKLKAVPIVFLTAIITKKEAEAGGWPLAGSEEAILAKPVVMEELDACIKDRLEGRPRIHR